MITDKVRPHHLECKSASIDANSHPAAGKTAGVLDVRVEAVRPTRPSLSADD